MLVILDRDGVINQDSIHYIKSPDEWIAIPSSLKAIRLLNDRGIKVIIATNQSGVGRGYYSQETLDLIHAKMHATLQTEGAHIDAIYSCPHVPEDQCICRKPKPGMLHQIMRDYPHESPQDLFFVGDALRDIEAAYAAGIKAILVRTGKGHEDETKIKTRFPDITVYNNLLEWVEKLSSRTM